MDIHVALQRVSDELEIASLLHRYARAVDTGDWDLWRSLFTEDAVIDHGSVGGAVGDRDEVSAWLECSLAQLPMTQHYISNIEGSRHLREENSWFDNPPGPQLRATMEG